MLPTRLSLAQRTTDGPSRLGLSDSDANVPIRVMFLLQWELGFKIFRRINVFILGGIFNLKI
jgi:hypothetical protein